MEMNVKNKKIQILKQFIDICNENNYWYSLDDLTLLSVFSNKNIDDKLDNYSIMMTFESYEALRAKYPKYVLDNAKHSEYHSLQIKFLENSEDIYIEQPFVNINLILPTSVKKINKFVNLKNKIKSSLGFYKSYKQSNILSIRNKIKLSKLFSFCIKPLLYKSMVNELYDENYEGFIITNPIISKHMLNKWIPHTTFKLVDEKLNGLDVKILMEHKNYLSQLYGKKYVDYDFANPSYNYLNAIELWDLNLIEQKSSKPTNNENQKEEKVEEK